MIEEVTLHQLGPILIEAKAKDHKVTVIERDTADPEWFLINTYTFKDHTLKKQDWSEILETELDEWVQKQRNPVYRLIDEVPMFSKVFADDSEVIKGFQDKAKRISQLTTPDGHDEVVRLLNEMTREFRCSERSGNSLAEMYLDDVREIASDLADSSQLDGVRESIDKMDDIKFS